VVRARWAARGVRVAPRAVIKGGPAVRLARGVEVGVDVRLVAGRGGVIDVGEGSRFNARCFVTAHERITIGRDVLFSSNVFVCDHLHGTAERDTPMMRQPPGKPAPVEIGDGCWLGINVAVMPGVRIGRQCVIGANAVVTEDVPDYSIAAGVPARVLRSL
jgi:acetyltransferase-like isoleucine patch superfamily enzyme